MLTRKYLAKILLYTAIQSEGRAKVANEPLVAIKKIAGVWHSYVKYYENWTKHPDPVGSILYKHIEKDEFCDLFVNKAKDDFKDSKNKGLKLVDEQEEFCNDLFQARCKELLK